MLCGSVNSLTSSTLTDQEYHIGGGPLDYTIPPFSVDPVGCSVSYTMIDPVTSNLISFDPDTLTFRFESSDLSETEQIDPW